PAHRAGAQRHHAAGGHRSLPVPPQPGPELRSGPQEPDLGAPMAVLNLRPIVGGRLLRGSQPFGMDAAEVAAFLQRQGIRTVVDLRTDYERALLPWPEGPW